MMTSATRMSNHCVSEALVIQINDFNPRTPYKFLSLPLSKQGMKLKECKEIKLRIFSHGRLCPNSLPLSL